MTINLVCPGEMTPGGGQSEDTVGRLTGGWTDAEGLGMGGFYPEIGILAVGKVSKFQRGEARVVIRSWN